MNDPNLDMSPAEEAEIDLREAADEEEWQNVELVREEREAWRRYALALECVVDEKTLQEVRLKLEEKQ